MPEWTHFLFAVVVGMIAVMTAGIGIHSMKYRNKQGYKLFSLIMADCSLWSYPVSCAWSARPPHIPFSGSGYTSSLRLLCPSCGLLSLFNIRDSANCSQEKESLF